MKNEIKLTFVGDIMCQREQNAAAWARHNDYIYDETFAAVAGLFKDSDYVIGNLETPIAGSLYGYTSEPSQFNTPETFLDALKFTGIDFLSTANNHCLDRGVNGLEQTLRNLQSKGFDYAGTYASREASEQIFIKEINGIRIAFLSFTYGTNSEYYGEPLADNETWRVDLLKKQPKRFNGSLQNRSLRARLSSVLPPRAKQAIAALLGRSNQRFSDFVPDNVSPSSINSLEHQHFVDRAKKNWTG